VASCADQVGIRLFAGSAVVRQQDGQVAQVDVTIAIHVALSRPRPAGRAVVGEQLRQVARVNIAVVIQVAGP
jgi:hypothetical protein